ncbi:MAG: hypothetical protein ACRDRC_14990, partial [Pseudonocardiaceae bacterium]
MTDRHIQCAEQLDVPVVFTSNGDSFVWHDRSGLREVKPSDDVAPGTGLDGGWSCTVGPDVDEGHPRCGEHVQVVCHVGWDQSRLLTIGVESRLGPGEIEVDLRAAAAQTIRQRH